MTNMTPVSLKEALDKLTFLPDRSPLSTPEDKEDAFARISAYRDGAVFIGHYAGNSEWERHSKGDEVVMVLEGETTLFLLEEGEERPHGMSGGELLVVPRGVWHRFESPKGVKVMTVTPQPTDHSVDRPE